MKILDQFQVPYQRDTKVTNVATLVCVFMAGLAVAFHHWVGMSFAVLATIGCLIWRTSMVQTYVRASSLVVNTKPARKRMHLSREADFEGCLVHAIVDEEAGTLQFCKWYADAGFPYNVTGEVALYQSAKNPRFSVIQHPDGGWFIAKLSLPKPFDPLMGICARFSIYGWNSIAPEATRLSLNKETLMLESKKRGLPIHE